MTKRRLIRWSLILAILAAFAVWLEPTRVVWGWLRGEAFYDGRPTSWWASELSRWTISEVNEMDENRVCRRHFDYLRTNNAFESFCSRTIGFGIERPAPSLLTGDIDAVPMLLELFKQPSEEVQKMARHGFWRARDTARYRNQTWKGPDELWP